ncbi:hypothetical protein HYW30_00275 [Candidatus Azambacteria bacterium]|nr:hypothetical protein [Candidatus Azambacteria bacterium]
MDLLSHALWTNILWWKKRRERQAFWAVIWAVAPDIISFAPLAVVLAFFLLSGEPIPAGPVAGRDVAGFRFVEFLYRLTHSFVPIGVVTLAAWGYRKRFPVPLLGWFLHIGIDIFSHSSAFYATQFLWPFSRIAFDGVSWRAPGFLMTNYAAIGLVYLILFWYNRRAKKTGHLDLRS